MKEKSKKIIFSVIASLICLAVIVGMFFVSTSAGVCTLVFGSIGTILGYTFGTCNKFYKIETEFYEKLLAYLEKLDVNTSLLIEENDETGEILFTLNRINKSKKKKES